MSGIVQEALTVVREWSGGPSRCPRVVGSHIQMSWSGRESNPDVLEWSGGTPGCPGVVGSPSQMSGCSWEARLDV